MQVIKFRVWVDAVEPGKMIYPKWVKFHEDGSKECDGYYGGVYMQYTGLKDRNGVDVYEGDLVECDDRIGGRMYGEVVYDNEYGAFRIVFSDIFQWTFYKAQNLEVIGNIFENPELLKRL